MTTILPPRLRNLSSKARSSVLMLPPFWQYIISTSLASNWAAVGKSIEPSAFAPRRFSELVPFLRNRGRSGLPGSLLLKPARVDDVRRSAAGQYKGIKKLGQARKISRFVFIILT